MTYHSNNNSNNSSNNRSNANSKATLNELKTSSFDRRLSMAKTSLNIGRRWASASLTGLFDDKTTREARKQNFRSEQSVYLVEELGKLKGSVVKVGQMMALYGEHLLPAEVTEALHHLNDNTAHLSWQTIKEVVYQQLGTLADELIIQTVPIGTASLAQVHRAVVKSTGEQVVLKIQYPGVADSIDSDLSIFTNLLRVSNIVPQTRLFDEWIAEIRELLYREVNYELEAQTTKNFHQRLADDDRYVVPKIYDKYCTPKIICMSYEEGVHINDERLQTLSQQRRNALGQSAIDIMLGEIFTWGEMQTDPNFGNYLVRLADSNTTDGQAIDKLVLLDFGAIRQFDDNLLSLARTLMSSSFSRDKASMITAMKTSNYDFFANMSEKVYSDMADVFLLATEPFCGVDKSEHIPDFCLDEEGRYLWAKSELHARLMKRTKSAMQSVEFSVPPKEFMFISRKFIGAYTLLTILDSRTHTENLLADYI